MAEAEAAGDLEDAMAAADRIFPAGAIEAALATEIAARLPCTKQFAISAENPARCRFVPRQASPSIARPALGPKEMEAMTGEKADFRKGALATVRFRQEPILAAGLLEETTMK